MALMAMVCFGSSVFAAADTTSASKSAAQTVYTYEDDTMKVTATLSDATAIPTGSTLKVEALTDQTTDENIKSLYTDAKSMMDNQSKNEKYTLDGFAAYNIYFKKDDNTYVPSTGTMTLDVTYKTANTPAAYTKSTDENKAVIVYQKTQIKDNLGNSTYVLGNLGTAKDADNKDIISQKALDESGNVTALTFKEGTYLPVILAWTENNAQAAANGVVTPAPTTEPTTTVTPAPTAEPTVTPAPTAAADNTTTPAVDNNNTNDTTNKDNYTLGDDKTTNEALVATAQADESALTDNTAKGVISTDAAGNKIKTYTYEGDDVTVTVSADDTSALPDDAVMSVTPVAVSADLQTKLASESVQPAAAYDISFKSESVEVEPAIAVRVMITPNNVEVGENTEVYHIADDGSLNNVYAQVDENTKLTFNSMCFSTYVITTNDASANNNRLDDWNSTDSVVEFTEVAPIVIGGTGEDSSNGMASVIDTGLQIAAKTAKEQVNNFSSYLITTVQAAESTLTGLGSGSVDTSNDTDGLYTNKSVSANSDGTWDINLEAYTTGTVKTTTSGVPADLVLTIDTSGSMYFTMGTSYSYSQLDTTKPDFYYHLGTNNYYTDYRNALIYRYNQWYIYHANGSWTKLSDINQYTQKDYYVIRMSALKEAASSFIDQVYSDATNTTEHSGQIVNHRIAITSFASNTGVNVSGFLDVSDSTNVTTLKTAISNLTPGGGTDTAGGMYRAWQYFYNDTPPSGTRSKVSVLFTDGEPTFHLDSTNDNGYSGLGNSFDSTGADQAITYANNMKNGKDKSGNKIGASVFTIGIFGGADPTSISSNANKFMNYVSSNYPSATSMSSGGTGKNNGFYLATDDADALSSIFKKISESVSHPTVILDSTTVLKDVISDYFKLDGDASVVSVKTAKYTGKDTSGNRTFSSTTTDISSNVKVAVDGQKVSVTGYDYSQHYVVDASGTVPTSGEKIIVTLKVKRQPWYYGGNATPTNTSASGIYNSDGTTTYVKFHEPSADVPILYEIGAQNESIYLTQNATASDIAKLGTDGITGGLNYTPDGTNNKYVDITYTLIDKDGKTVTDSSGNPITTTVAAGTALPTGGLFSSQQISGLTNDTTYKVKAVVSSVNNPSKEDGSEDGVPNQTKTASGTVYVFKPTVTAKDSTIFLGDTETLGADNSIASVDWTNSKTSNKPDGDAPALNYTFEDTTNVAATTVSPLTDTDYKIATVKVGDTDITSNTTIQNAGTVNHFTVHVVKGQILLTKTINQQYSGIQAIKANQTFVFKIQKQDIEGGPTTATFYETINFDANAGNLTGERLISGLSKGIYTITEETSWSPKYSLDNSTGNGVVVKVGYKDPTSNEYIALEDLGNNGYSAATATSGPSYGTFDPTDNSNSKTIDTGKHSYSEIGVTGHHATVGFKNNIDSNWNWLSDTAAAINVFNQ